MGVTLLTDKVEVWLPWVLADLVVVEAVEEAAEEAAEEATEEAVEDVAFK